jgi:hypothetical protein
VDLEAAEAELNCQRQDFAWKQATHPLDDDNVRTGALSGLCFPCATYNMAATTYYMDDMVATAYYLDDISDTPDPKTNERLKEVKWLLCVALE